MIIYGNTNILSGNVQSNISEDVNKPQNMVVIPSATTYNGSLDKEVTIIDLAKHEVLTCLYNNQNWYNAINRGVVVDDHISGTLAHPGYTSVRYFSGNSTYRLDVDNTVLSGLNSNFVIDFFLQYGGNPGMIIYNGRDTGQIGTLEDNRNFLLTLHSNELINTSLAEDNIPGQIAGSGTSGRVILKRPFIQSTFSLVAGTNYHIAVIRSGSTMYLAIDGKIHGSAPAVNFFAYDWMRLMAGYITGCSGYLWNFRISTTTDRGWTTDFDIPIYNHTDIGSTKFLLKSDTLTDLKGYSVIQAGGNTPTLYTGWNLPIHVPKQNYTKWIISAAGLSADTMYIYLPKVVDSNNDTVSLKFKFTANQFNMIRFQTKDGSLINTILGGASYQYGDIYNFGFDWANKTINFRYHKNQWNQFFEDDEKNIIGVCKVTVNQTSGSLASSYNHATVVCRAFDTIFNRALGTYFAATQYVYDNPVFNAIPIYIPGDAGDLQIGGTSVYTSTQNYLIEAIVKFTDYPSFDEYLFHATDSYNGYTAQNGIILNANLTIQPIMTYRYYRYYNYVHSARSDSTTDSLQSINGVRSTSPFKLNNWYHLYFKFTYEVNVSDRTNLSTYFTADNLTTGIRETDNQYLLGQNMDYYDYYYYNSTMVHETYGDTYYDYYRTTYNYGRILPPLYLNRIANMQLLMARIRRTSGSLSVPATFTRYYKYSDYLASF